MDQVHFKSKHILVWARSPVAHHRHEQEGTTRNDNCTLAEIECLWCTGWCWSFIAGFIARSHNIVCPELGLTVSSVYVIATLVIVSIKTWPDAASTVCV